MARFHMIVVAMCSGLLIVSARNFLKELFDHNGDIWIRYG